MVSVMLKAMVANCPTSTVPAWRAMIFSSGKSKGGLGVWALAWGLAVRRDQFDLRVAGRSVLLAAGRDTQRYKTTSSSRSLGR